MRAAAIGACIDVISRADASADLVVRRLLEAFCGLPF